MGLPRSNDLSPAAYVADFSHFSFHTACLCANRRVLSRAHWFILPAKAVSNCGGFVVLHFLWRCGFSSMSDFPFHLLIPWRPIKKLGKVTSKRALESLPTWPEMSFSDMFTEGKPVAGGLRKKLHCPVLRPYASFCS